MTRTRQRALATFILPLALAAGGCHPSDDGKAEGLDNAAEALERALAPREVRLVATEPRVEQPTLELVGEVRAFDTVVISSEVAGRVDRVHVEVGDRVAEGAPLVEVDRETFAILLAQAEANAGAAGATLELARKDLERKRDLRTDETIPQATLDQAQASYDLAAAQAAAAEAALRLARRNHERSVIRAPAAGAITERMVVAGQWAEVGAGLLELAVGGKVKVAARVPEGWAGRFTRLESFSFSVGADREVRTAQIYSLQPVVREASRSYEIVGTSANDGSLKPGMFATVTLTSPDEERSLWLPATAVATSDLPQVLMVEDDAIVYRKVRIGRRDNGLVEIVDGLAEGERVVADVAGLSRGLPVKVIE
ncbi:MAG: efflux RND transporter periplasmic adaptor subunit [Thermoanaerobaculales bacterium]|jgi:membrane fusion protein (multidrug efflux system)|nr:efflux RND transporter periplasmic adaptor subunit [Thermoanaerobaculales bacterium]